MTALDVSVFVFMLLAMLAALMMAAPHGLGE
jgi:hypothetical protein